jgi:hypothetical protein
VKTYSLCDVATGFFTGRRLMMSEDAAKANTPPGQIRIEGAHDPLSRRFDVATGDVVDYQPPPPSRDHEWDATIKRWKLTAVAAKKIEDRSAALAEIARLEASQQRALREIALGDETGAARQRLTAIEDEIAGLRKFLGNRAVINTT